MENSEKKHVRSRFWLGFSIGLMAGLIFAVVFYFVDKSLKGPIQLLISPPAAETSAPVEEAPEEKPVSPYVGKTITVQNTAKRLPAEDTTELITDDSTLMDDEFTLEEADGTEQVYYEHCLAQRTITVKSDEGTPPITAFEVEEWSESAVNKISYLRNDNVLKIKGLKIQNLKIIFHKKQYYIEYNGRHYPIPENEEFHRLTPTQLP